MNLPQPPRYLLTDSRQLTAPGESVFFAIKGLHHDGHRFIAELYQKGVRQFVIEQADFGTKTFPEATFFNVESSLAALQELVAAHRRKFNIPVVGITGSNGKTIVKEWLAQLLSPEFVVCKSPKSYNSQLGVPLAVWQLAETHTLGIFEAGVSRPGEMAALERIIQPSIGIFTNIGSAHDEGFTDRRQKIREKLELFRHVKTLIYCDDYTEITTELDDFLANDCYVITWNPTDLWTEFNLQPLPYSDAASRENLGHCVVLLRHLGIHDDEISRRLQTLRPVSMRLELKEGLNGCYIVDDSYNNDLVGLKMALDFLANQQQRPHRVAILSDMLQSGLPEGELYEQIARLLKDKGVNQLIGIGPDISRHQMAFALPAKFYASTEDFLSRFRPSDFQRSVVLVKGARPFQFERVTNRLTVRTHGTVLEVNLDALSHNLNYFREKVGRDTRIMVMVKAFAYGSGIEEVANLLQFHRVDYLAVAYADEGVRLRQSGIRLPIMVMNPSPETFQQLLDHQLEPEIYSLRIWRELVEFLQNPQFLILDFPFSIHIKLDTGMHRLGFDESDLPTLLNELKSHPEIQVTTVFSHLAAADEPEWDDFTRNQLACFTRMADQIEAVLGYDPIRHLANSAGLARFPETRLDMVRLGKGLYGTAVRTEDQANLRTVGTLRTIISQIKTVKAGETVGYGRRGLITHDSRIATIAIGYADGYDRSFSRGVGKVLVNGTLCPVMGNVCMDMTMIDITGVDAQEGDEVVLFGDYPTIRDLAAWSGTIPYEILTGVSERVRRVFYREGN
ncbi:MAG: bifunctional UDP-N-acetylmuramoyl-tripeptide:D-alanyl-D-alanine ligase/alanine racemase [Cytophagaceae bacterium]|nr:bifunctional UDP-N-acetylmuramoyl-tripeptide:D-alanyl-D-alanine ligase/alanine racemase [Cytophagaceae bacterium]